MPLVAVVELLLTLRVAPAGHDGRAARIVEPLKPLCEDGVKALVTAAHGVLLVPALAVYARGERRTFEDESRASRRDTSAVTCTEKMMILLGGGVNRASTPRRKSLVRMFD